MVKSIKIIVWGLVLFLTSCTAPPTPTPKITDSRIIQGTLIGYKGGGQQAEAKVSFYNEKIDLVDQRIIGKSELGSDGSFSFKLRETLPDEWLLEFDRFGYSRSYYCPDMTISKPNAKRSAEIHFQVSNVSKPYYGWFKQGSSKEILSYYDSVPLDENFRIIDRIYANQAFNIQGTCQFSDLPYRSLYNLRFKKGWNLATITFDDSTNTLSQFTIQSMPEDMKWFYGGDKTK